MSSSSAIPMDIGGLDGGKGDGKGKSRPGYANYGGNRGKGKGSHGGSNYGGGGTYCDRDKGKGRGKGKGKNPDRGKGKHKGKHKGQEGKRGKKCYSCGSPDHFAAQCPHPNHRQVASLSQSGTDQQHQDGPEHYDISDDGPESAPVYGIMLSSLEISGLEEQKNEKVTFGVDTGAAATVMKFRECKDYPIDESLAQNYTAANGSSLQGKGQRVLESVEGLFVRTGVSDQLRKNLLCVADMCDVGHRVVFDNDEGYYAEHKQSGQRIWFKRNGKVFDLTLKIQPYSKKQAQRQPFHRQGGGL